MILLAFLAFFGMNNLSFENFKEINFKEELIFQPKLLENSIFLFFEKKILKLRLDSFDIENFFGEDKYNISENGIIFERNGEKFLLSFGGKESKINMENPEDKNWKNLYDFKAKIKKIFTDAEFLYAQTEDNFLHCIRVKYRKRIWKIKVPLDILSIISDRKRVYILCGSDIVLSLKKKGGDIIWWKSVKERCFPRIEFLNDNLVVSHRGGIQFLNPKNGSLNGKLDVAMSFAPVITADYLILFKTDKALIYNRAKE